MRDESAALEGVCTLRGLADGQMGGPLGRRLADRHARLRGRPLSARLDRIPDVFAVFDVRGAKALCSLCAERALPLVSISGGLVFAPAVLENTLTGHVHHPLTRAAPIAASNG